MFLTQEKTVYVCGGNSFGQLGIGSKSMQMQPIKLESLKNVRYLAAWHYSAAVTEEDRLFVWGTGIFGESLLPKLVENGDVMNVDHIAVGGSFAIIVDTNGKVYAWGANTNGELGTGDTQPRVAPALIDALEDKTIGLVGVGSAFAFALGSKPGLTSSQITQEEGQQAPGVQKELMKLSHFGSSYNASASIPEVRIEEEEDELGLSRKTTFDRMNLKHDSYN
jgi:hypothetical protein